jgi:hypothetical protein
MSLLEGGSTVESSSGNGLRDDFLNKNPILAEYMAAAKVRSDRFFSWFTRNEPPTFADFDAHGNVRERASGYLTTMRGRRLVIFFVEMVRFLLPFSAETVRYVAVVAHRPRRRKRGARRAKRRTETMRSGS